MLEKHVVRSRSLRSRLLGLMLRYRLKPKLTSAEFDPVRFRNWLNRTMNSKLAKGVTCLPLEQDGLRGEWLFPATESDSRCVLYLHGGGYLFGSPQSYRGFSSRLAQLMHARVFVLDYRLAPEHPFPAAVEDAEAAYRYLLAQNIRPEQIILAGDSAGGGLAFALLHVIKQKQLPMPVAQISLSPYTDLHASGESVTENSSSCVMFDAESIPRAAAIYLDGASADNPLASPLYGDLEGFPPQLMYVSDTEVLRDDGLRMAEKLGEAGVAVHLNIWRGQPHVWPVFYPLIPEADVCIREMAAFAGRYW